MKYGGVPTLVIKCGRRYSTLFDLCSLCHAVNANIILSVGNSNLKPRVLNVIECSITLFGYCIGVGLPLLITV